MFQSEEHTLLTPSACFPRLSSQGMNAVNSISVCALSLMCIWEHNEHQLRSVFTFALYPTFLWAVYYSIIIIIIYLFITWFVIRCVYKTVFTETAGFCQYNSLSEDIKTEVL